MNQPPVPFIVVGRAIDRFDGDDLLLTVDLGNGDFPEAASADPLENSDFFLANPLADFLPRNLNIQSLEEMPCLESECTFSLRRHPHGVANGVIGSSKRIWLSGRGRGEGHASAKLYLSQVQIIS